MTESIKISNSKVLKLQETLGELFTPEEVAEYFKVHLVTVYNWVKTKKIDCYILTKGTRKSTVRFDIDQIQKFIQSRNMM
ncbi:MAG: helix-turn-helix domain-containing protein [Candidatus Latescibacteria bacterium]|nr:helix-turn-helix domain-containing protein [Candidatus Latescibacterota bacterium]